MTGDVLIVDDSLTVRMDLLETLQEAGILATACATAQEARTKLAGMNFSLVILDVLLPDGDGIDILKEIREYPSAAGTVVMLLSTEADVRDRIRGLTMGADEYIGKPYEASYVVARARELLRGRQVAAAPTGKTILIIDDSLTFREELKHVLEDASYTVLAAGTGEDGLRIAADVRPDAIIVDGVLPGIDGATVVRRIRLDAALRHTPCLLLTASEGLGAEIQALEAGADAFVRKDEDVTVALARLAAVLRSAGAQADNRGTTSLLGPKKVLAVDDSETYLQELAEALRGEGYDVVLARSGEEALELLSIQAVDCILLDLMMPGMSGHEACRLVKSSPAIRETPVVMLTAREDRDAIIEGLNAGADDYIVKSSDFQVLRARVLAQIRRKQFEDENRRIRDQMLRRELEATEARAAQELAETRAALVDELERKNVELAAASLAKSNFLASMSHEIRTPMNAVIGLSELALRTDLTPKQHDYLTKIKASAKSLLGIINDILDLSKIEAGRLDLEHTEFELRAVLDDLATVSALAAAEKGIELVFSVDPELPELLVGDPLRLGQVLHNLVGNAVKFTRQGEIVVSIRVTGREADRVALDVSVADTGIGMSAETISALFRPFTQADSSTTRRFGGTGLGLAISQQLVARMESNIVVESTPGTGSIFKFSVWLGVAKVTEERSARSLATMGRIRVLVVDDNARSRQILETMLTYRAVAVRTASSGLEACESVQRATAEIPFDLILLDWQMPGLDGIETARKLKDILPPAKMPKIVMMTAYGRDDLTRQIPDLEIAGILAKPISNSTLLDAISSALGQNSGGIRYRRNDSIRAGQSAAAGARVLLVDDNDINRQVGAETLTHAGVNVYLAASGEEAVAKVLNSGVVYDAILMDVQMPGMDGLEATRLIRERLAADQLPIIALTAHALDEERQKHLAAGMNDHVAKPIDPAVLVATLGRWITPHKLDSATQKTTLAPNTATSPDPHSASEDGDIPDTLLPFDLVAALARLNGNRVVLKRLLLMFGDEFSGAAQQLNEAIRSEKLKDAQRLAHTLKSAAASLEASAVATAARRIEESLQRDQLDTLPALIDQLETALVPALAAVASLSGP
ncbi:MAG: response regulator [Rhodospirillaceae bacterium]|nr:MAG: response regulator [Rhodospirillaceae bacterium]